MARFSVGWTKAAVATNTWIAELRAPSGRDLRVWEVSIDNTTAVASDIGLYRATAQSGTPTSIVPVADDTSAGTAQAAAVVAATTAPTIGTNVPIRRALLAPSVGAGRIWTFPAGLVVPVSGSLVLWNNGAATSAALEGYFVYDE